MRFARLLVSMILSLVEAGFVMASLYTLIGWVFGLPWRTWIDDSFVARGAPSGVLLAGMLLLFRLRATRSRWALPQQTPSRSDRWVAASMIAMAPLCLLISVDRFVDTGTLRLITATSLGVSIVSVLSIALAEEFIYRYVLMGRMLRLGMPMLLAIVIQAAIFLLGHGKQALVAPQTITWYLVGGVCLGTVYAATRSIWASVAMHALVDICMAQTSAEAFWFTHRTIEAVSRHWPDMATGAWSALLIFFWLHRYQRAAEPTARPTPIAGR